MYTTLAQNTTLSLALIMHHLRPYHANRISKLAMSDVSVLSRLLFFTHQRTCSLLSFTKLKMYHSSIHRTRLTMFPLPVHYKPLHTVAAMHPTPILIQSCYGALSSELLYVMPGASSSPPLLPIQENIIPFVTEPPRKCVHHAKNLCPW